MRTTSKPRKHTRQATCGACRRVLTPQGICLICSARKEFVIPRPSELRNDQRGPDADTARAIAIEVPAAVQQLALPAPWASDGNPHDTPVPPTASTGVVRHALSARHWRWFVAALATAFGSAVALASGFLLAGR